MPKTKRPGKKELARLASLPRQSDLMLDGILAPVGLYTRKGERMVQAQMALWLDPATEMIRGSAPAGPREGDDGGVNEALQALVMALAEPVALPPQLLQLAGVDIGKRRGKDKKAGADASGPALPRLIRVNDEALAAAARAFLAPLDIPVETIAMEEMPAAAAAFRDLATSLGADPDAPLPEPFSWDVDTALLAPLFAATKGFIRRAPWTYMSDYPPLEVTLGEHGPRPETPTLYACVMGGGEMVQGIAFYDDLAALQRVAEAGEELMDNDAEIDAAIEAMRQSGMGFDGVSTRELRDMVRQMISTMSQEQGQGEDAQGGAGGGAGLGEAVQDSLVLFVEDGRDTDPTYLEWLRGHGQPYTARQKVPVFLSVSKGGENHPPDARETAAMTLAIEALNGFFTVYQHPLDSGLIPVDSIRYSATVGDGVSVSIAYPPVGFDVLALEGDDDDDDDEDNEEDDPLANLPATEAGKRTLYRFKVTLKDYKDVWRRIEISGDETLYDLHGAIQEAFDWDDDHLWSFFLSGKAWDDDTEYTSPFGNDGRNAAAYRLERLALRKGASFLYIFDYGDEWRHTIKLEAVTPNGVAPGVDFPRVSERHGDSIPQYPAWEDEEGEEDEEADEEGEGTD